MDHRLLGALAALSMTACGGMNPVQPKDMTAGMAAGEGIKCNDAALADEAMTFVVDWKDGQRAALESAMGKGVAVVKYSCNGVKVLPACRVRGDYGYAGSTQRKKVINMKDAVQAQAQFGGRHIGASFQGQFAQGRSLSLAYTTVGASSTTVTTVDKSMLTGRCKGATHFVYEAEVGAFAVATTSKGEASAFGEVFGQGSASGATASGKSAMTADGNIKACSRASKKDTDSVADCSAIVRISLLPVEAKGGGRKSVGVPDVRSCPPGYVYTDDECVPKAEASTFLCDKSDYQQCFTQCAKGHMGSCGRLGLMDIKGEEDVRAMTKDAALDAEHFQGNAGKVVKNLQRACLVAGEANACIGAKNAAFHEAFFKYDDKDLEEPKGERLAREQMDFELIEAGCRGGEGFACTALLDEFRKKKGARITPSKALLIIHQACSRSPVACGVAGHMYSNVYGTYVWSTLGSLLPPRANDSIWAYERACDGGLADGCYALGFMHLPTDRVGAIMKRLETQDKSTDTETRGAIAYSRLGAGKHDVAKGMAYLKRACAMGEKAMIDGDNEIACGAIE